MTEGTNRKKIIMREKIVRPGYDPEAERKNAYEWIQCFCVALIICVFFFLFIIRVVDVKGTSMLPTLKNADKMIVSGLFYKPKNGDVVVFKKDEYSTEKALVKRVIATEGQEVNIDFTTGQIWIDNVELDEPYIADLTKTKLDFIGPKKVPEGCVFVLGDNRNMSIDSRKTEIGMVDERLLLGRVYGVIFPVNRIKIVN